MNNHHDSGHHSSSEAAKTRTPHQRKLGSNGSIAHSIANEVISKSVTTIRNQQARGGGAVRSYTSASAEQAVEREVEDTENNNMPPDDSSSIISGHKIALNVHYDKDNHDAVQTAKVNGVVHNPVISDGKFEWFICY